MGLEICYGIGLALMLSGAILSLALFRIPRWASVFGCAGMLSGCAAAAVAVLADFAGDVNNVFRLSILLLGAAGAVHSIGYLNGHGKERSGLYFFLYNLTVSAMLGVTLAIRELPFLVLWELMGAASFALVAFDFKSERTVRAAWIYLLGCQAGGMLLMMLFAYDSSPLAVFILALAAFGLKIGFLVLHVWLPEAHPAAPAPVSALMSGAMIQLGFYGITRWGIRETLQNSAIYGTTFVVLGCLTALAAILFAMPRRNIKTLLAYSSIENMGIISMGFGLGYLGVHFRSVPLQVCGFGAAYLHMLNHALLKGGLFLGAGSILKACGSLDMDRMGGMLKKMPFTGGLFLFNGIGISGLPPFNGFVSEFLIYLGAFIAIAGNVPLLLGCGMLVAVALALTGSVAAAVFFKMISAVFLGDPRSQAAEEARETALSMLIPAAVLFGLSCLVVFTAPILVGSFLSAEKLADAMEVIQALAMLSRFTGVFAGVLLLLLAVRFYILPGGRKIRHAVTWDCGYTAPDSRMQYTGSAFIQPLTVFFHWMLGSRKEEHPVQGDFPAEASFEEKVSDPVLEKFWGKIFSFAADVAGKVHFLQSGYLHIYILIMTAALILMLITGLVLNGGF